MDWPLELIEKAKKILDIVYGDNVTPKKEDALRLFDMNPNSIKVVIIGQDPYPTKGVANGRAFAVNIETPIPKSLQNIFKELEEIYGPYKTDRTLKHWEEQGVLLLNTSLTTEINNPNAHRNNWRPFTDELIKWIDNNLNVTFVLWGNEAKKYLPIIKNKTITDAHPSPLSVRRRSKETFKKLNNIDW